jgi:hypothetical protein
MAGKRRAAVTPVDDEVVPLGLAANRLLDGGKEQIV